MFEPDPTLSALLALAGTQIVSSTFLGSSYTLDNLVAVQTSDGRTIIAREFIQLFRAYQSLTVHDPTRTLVTLTTENVLFHLWRLRQSI